MNFAIPRKNNSETLLYIWKIIDLPSISQDELFFKISFELFLFAPKEAYEFIESCIENKLLDKDNDHSLKLSKSLNQRLETWQENRKNAVLHKITSYNQITQLNNNIENKNSSNFNVLINAFTDKGTLNRSVSVSDTAFELLEYNLDKGILKSKVKGSKEEPYIIEVNTIEKILKHNCHDFEARRADNKKFCKHLTKLFLLLKNKNENIAEFFLKNIAENINEWDFIT